MKKIISILLLAVAISLLCSIYVYAEDTGISDVIGAMGETSEMASAENGFGKIINIIIGIIQVAGTGIALIAILILGIKYLLTSPSEKAETKKSILPIIIGCILLFGAVNLMSTLYNFTQSSFDNGSGQPQ